MNGGWQLFSPTILVKVEGSLVIWWVDLYAIASVWRRGEREKHKHALARLARTCGAGCGMVRRGDLHGCTMCA
jgi:hypothetical protein